MKAMHFFLIALFVLVQTAQALERVKYNNPDLIVDLGVGLWAWPIPMDYDSDGDYDLLVSCPDKPSSTTARFLRRDRSDKPRRNDSLQPELQRQ